VKRKYVTKERKESEEEEEEEEEEKSVHPTTANQTNLRLAMLMLI